MLVFSLESTRCALRMSYRIDFSYFPWCPALWMLSSSSWQWCMLSSWQWHMYAFIMMLLVDDYFNKSYLLIIIYELLDGDNVWNWFDWLFPVSSSMPLLYVYSFSWCSLMMITLELTSSLAITDFLILESISYFVSNLINKYFQFQWTNNCINPHPSCAVLIAFLAEKQTT